MFGDFGGNALYLQHGFAKTHISVAKVVINIYGP